MLHNLTDRTAASVLGLLPQLRQLAGRDCPSCFGPALAHRGGGPLPSSWWLIRPSRVCLQIDRV